MTESASTIESCSTCGKPSVLCVCDRVKPHKSRWSVVVLQHPQEADVLLGTAPLLRGVLPGTKVVPGLSWANLSDAMGREVDPARWAILYPHTLHKELTESQLKQPVVLLDRNGDPMPVLAGKKYTLDGIVVLDGSWSQAKTLWWRNPWVLKHSRLVLHPREPSAYGRLRQQPRREGLSTLESATEALVGLGEDEELRTHARSLLRTLCQRARDAFAAGTVVDSGEHNMNTDEEKPAPKRRGRPVRRKTGGGVLE